MEDRLQLGIQIIPQMPPQEVVNTVQAAERMGFDYALICDEGFMPDPYVLLGVLAGKTQIIRLGLVTNGYTRHPAVTANSLATFNEISGGRAVVMLVAGGSMVLDPMGIPREDALTVTAETMDILRLLWSGEPVSYQGKRYRLNRARLQMTQQEIPIWVAARGPKMLEMAGQKADAVVVIAKADLGSALEIVDTGSAALGRHPMRIYMDTIANTSEAIAHAASSYPYILMDSPARMLHNLGLTENQVEQIRQAMKTGGPEAAGKLVTLDMIKRYQIAGTPQECTDAIRELVDAFRLDAFLLDIVSGGQEANLRLMENVAAMVKPD